MFRYILVAFIFIFLQSYSGDSSRIGEPIDSFNGVEVYYNGRDFKNVSGRNVTSDGYNLGLKYQCVEFVKRYYYEVYHHKMPNSYGHAREFFDKSLGDGMKYNEGRGLMQIKNTGYHAPQIGDILVYGARSDNPFGHIGIIIDVQADHIILMQQNYGTKTRQKIKLVEYGGIYTVADYDVLGWLRIP